MTRNKQFFHELFGYPARVTLQLIVRVSDAETRLAFNRNLVL